MKDIIRLLILNLLSITLVVGGVHLATKGIPGWGWLIFLGASIGIYDGKNKNS